MGRFSLLIQSDLNRLDLYDFGDNPAGLVAAPPPFENCDKPIDYTSCELFGSGLYEELSFQEIFIVGQPVPKAASRFLPPQPQGDWWLGFSYPSRPAGFYYRSRSGNSAIAVQANFSHLHLFEPDPPDYTVSTPELEFTWAHRSGGLDWAVDLMAFDAVVRNQEHRTGAGALLGIGRTLDKLNWGLNLGYFHPHSIVDDGSSIEHSGEHAARGMGTVIFQPLDLLKLGVNAGYRWATHETNCYHSPGIDVRCILNPPGTGTIAGVDLNWAGSYPNRSDLAWGREDSFRFVFGLGHGAENWFAGLEIAALRGSSVWQQQESHYTRIDVGIGGEIGLGEFRLRAGARHLVSGASPGMSVSRVSLACGMGWASGPLRLDLAYNHFRYQTFDIDNDILQLSLRYHLGR